MKIFDSYTNDFKQLKNKKITIYNCGPTVYNHTHIGNARPLITMDVLYRYLLSKNNEVHYVSNITDIDDKIINYALETNQSEEAVSTLFLNHYNDVKRALNALPNMNPRVSDYIDQMINYIDQLIKKGYAYEINGDYYFDTSKVKNYGQLSKRNLASDIAGKRILNNENKRNDQDFVLWKKTNKGIVFNAPFGVGRPGWHTECVCLINHLIGDSVDIHGGGNDLKFPHHENENAQNVAMHDKNLASVWMHFGLVEINDEKMSKSLNNFILTKDILTKYDFRVLRWFFMQTSYRSPIKYSEQIMEDLAREVKKMENTINLGKNALLFNNQLSSIPLIKKHHDFDQAMENDLDLVQGVDILRHHLKDVNKYIKDENYDELAITIGKIIYILELFGINFIDKHSSDVNRLLFSWKEKVDNKEYEEADKIRADLMAENIL
ncbi:cysteine--tRNA ligase [Ureaplasma canigenitalium]|uniref:cysteine--tRNA ligase n=1 Tax=Ureaplasma canigenitalium TaxID=42092 RepID=UPI0004E21AA3|nr:cysteine--tRNA ligase [Ureaplasma canigenitalium]